MGQVAEKTGVAVITTPAPEAVATGGPQTVKGFTVYDAMLLGMVVVWAANPAGIKWALRYMDPLVFNSLRFLLATMFPVTLALLNKEKLRPLPGDWWRILGLGLIGHGFYQFLFIMAINNTLAGNVVLILSINPAFVAVFSALFGYERIRVYTWIGVLLSLAGVSLVVLGSGEELHFGSRLLGDAIMLAVTVMWALYTVLSQPLLKRYSAVKLNALTMPVGATVLLLAATPALVGTTPQWTVVPASVWLVMALSGLLAVSASYIIWYKGIQKLGSSRTSVYSNLVPVLGAVISAVFLGESLGWQFWAGMVLVLAGVTTARFGARLFGRMRFGG